MTATKTTKRKKQDNDRGPYRSCFIAMADDADIHAMSGDAFKLFWMLKLTLPTAGIGVVYDSALIDRMGGISRDRLAELYAELEAPKPSTDRGWILKDRNIVWVMRGLDCEPGMSAESPNHRTNVQGSVKQLLQRSPVVTAFKEFYWRWFIDVADWPPEADSDKEIPKGIEGDSKGLTKGLTNPSQGDSEPEAVAVAVQKQFNTGEVVDLDHPPAAGAVDAPAANSSAVKSTDSPAAQGASNNPGKSPPPADDAGLGSLWQLLGECYDLTGKPTAASKPRQKQVYRDLRATLTEKGALLERDVYVRAVDAAHLNAVCRNVLTRVEEKDAAIRLVLLELRDTWQGVKAEREKAALGEEPAPRRPVNQKPASPSSIASLIPKPKAKGLDDAERWLTALGDQERERVAAELEREVNLACPVNVNAPSTRAQLRADLLVKTWQRRDEQEGAA